MSNEVFGVAEAIRRLAAGKRIRKCDWPEGHYVSLREKNSDGAIMRSDGWEFRTIGEKYGMSRQRVHQLVVKGLAQMREFLKERGIASEDIRW